MFKSHSFLKLRLSFPRRRESSIKLVSPEANQILNSVTLKLFAFCILLFTVSVSAYNPPERIIIDHPTFEQNTTRDLRYKPDQTDFVIHNGTESFNRPLYGGNTAFRTDTGDLPEFSFYMPRHGGVLRFGFKTNKAIKWFHQADSIESRYRPGSMIYTITDPALGNAKITLIVIGLYDSEGIISKIEIEGDTQAELIVSFGGIGGRKGRRSGDIGCESQPVNEFFKLKPEYCQDNIISVNAPNNFTIQSKHATFTATVSSRTVFGKADSHNWDNLPAMLTSFENLDLPVALGRTPLNSNSPIYFALQKHTDSFTAPDRKTLADLFNATEQTRKSIANKVTIDSPDPYINAAASALCIAADAIWDSRQASVMHGAVAWRSKYLGWRGPYANDTLGWHDRSKQHLTYWSKQQDTSPVPDSILPADPKANLARNEPSLHSNGTLSHKHYDMNLVYMDALFRYIMWTGDFEFAKELWPVIEKHMAWEKRLFRRPFGDDGLPLYEAYAAIWASDDLQYNGGGVTHASAYNYFHNMLVAEIAEKLGKDSEPYKKEASLIKQAMDKYLWLEDGWFAEYKDLLGTQSTHPAAALWTFYHTLDCGAATPKQAWQMSRFVDTQIAHITVYGGDITKGKYHTLPTSSWMPYTWSTNNVVFAEVANTALAYYQANRPNAAYSILKGCILDSMYMGLCPGNAGMTTHFDMARGEAQRDFGDGIGTCSRAIVEGLFGIQPDQLNNTLIIKPGLPEDWNHASITHPNISYSFKQTQFTQEYTIEQNFSKLLSLQFQIRSKFADVESIMVNDKKVKPASFTFYNEAPYLNIQCDKAKKYEIKITYTNSPLCTIDAPKVVAEGHRFNLTVNDAALFGVDDPQNALPLRYTGRYSTEYIASNKYGHHTIFAAVGQGNLTWFRPIDFEIRKPYDLIPAQTQSTDSLAFKIQNNTADTIDSDVVFTSNLISKVIPMVIKPFSTSEQISLPTDLFRFFPGTNRITVLLNEKTSFETDITNWHLNQPANIDLEAVTLDSFYNDKLTNIFKNEYLSPRSPYCSLAIPKQGIGSWCDYARQFEVDDSGLIAAASANDGLFKLPQGITFKVPVTADTKNTIFTSQWDNYPNKKEIPLIGKAHHLYLLMAGSTNSMQSQFNNGMVTVTYADGKTEKLSLKNPTTWWPIDQDYFIDDYGFNRPQAIPPRVDLKTGLVRILDVSAFKGKGGKVPGGAATVLDLPLDPGKELKSLTIETLANEVVIGLMSASLVR